MTIPVCSFCKRPGPKVSYLVQGPDNLLICDNCVAASVDTVAKKDRGWRDRQIDHLLSLAAPKVSYLVQVAATQLSQMRRLSGPVTKRLSLSTFARTWISSARRCGAQAASA